MRTSIQLGDKSNLPTLYWISGSPPCWRVMLGLLVKQIDYSDVQLDYSQRENHNFTYLALNAKGQVPTFVHDEIIISESIAILAYLEAAFEGPSLFGSCHADVAKIWQMLMDFENNLRPHVTSIAQLLLRGKISANQTEFNQAVQMLDQWCQQLNNLSWNNAWIVTPYPSVVDCWLYPALAWIERAMAVSKEAYPHTLKNYLEPYDNLTRWQVAVQQLPDFNTTLPPHWLS